MNTETVTIIYARDGKSYTGSWWVDDGWLFVRHPNLGQKDAKAGPAPAVLAPILLREMLDDSTRHRRRT